MVDKHDNGVAAEAAKKSRHRSPNYPSIGLRVAMGKIQSLFKAGGTAPLMKITALKGLGFDKDDANAARGLAALKSFGLIEEVGNDRLKLSQRGLDIVARQEGEPQRAAALRAAILGPQIYRELLTEYAASGIPPDAALTSELIAAKKFNPNVVDDFIKDFRDTLDFAGLSDISVLESNAEVEDLPAHTTTEAATTIGAAFAEELKRGSTSGEALSKIGDRMGGAPLLAQTLVISIPRDFKVDIGVRGDELKKEDLAKIKSQFDRWIEGLEEAFE